MGAQEPAVGAQGAELFHFRVPGRLEYRDAARTFITHVCEQLVVRHHLPPELPHRVISAFNEACNNAVIHAYRDRQAGPIEVELTVTTETLRLRIPSPQDVFPNIAGDRPAWRVRGHQTTPAAARPGADARGASAHSTGANALATYGTTAVK